VTTDQLQWKHVTRLHGSPHSQTADMARPHLHRFARHEPCPVWKRFSIMCDKVSQNLAVRW